LPHARIIAKATAPRNPFTGQGRAQEGDPRGPKAMVAKKEIAMHRWLVVLFLIMLVLPPASAVAAIEVAGVLLPEKVRLSPDSPPLGLNGAGVHRRYLFIELYVAALYLASRKLKRALLGSIG
jgi:hypothetical protein